LRARDDKVGRKLKCPKCRQSLMVPSQTDAALQDESAVGADDPFSELVVYDDEIVYETEEDAARVGSAGPEAAGEGAFEPRHVAIPRWMLYVHAGVLAFLAIMAFVLGLLIGGSTREDRIAAAPPKPVEIGGSLRWEAVTGEIGDKGAAVVIWPVGRTPQKKIEAARLLVDKPAPKRDDPAYQAILELGGDYARAGDGGHFYVQLVPGTYRVLLVSNNAQRPAGEDPKPEEVAEVGAIFAPPPALFGKQKYRLSTMDLNQQSKIDYFFGESAK